MRSPSTPRGWLSWSASVTDSYHRVHSPRIDDCPRPDRRLSSARETAISIIRLCEKSANGNGGAGLLYSFYVEEASWWSFSEPEQRILAKTAREFAKALSAEGFLPGKG